MNHYRAALLLCCAFAIPAFAGPSRTWTAADGTTMRAEFTGVLDGKIVLKQGSKRHYIAFDQFNSRDQAYLRIRLQAMGKLDQVEGASAKPDAGTSEPEVTDTAGADTPEMEANSETTSDTDAKSVDAADLKGNPLAGQIPIPYERLLEKPSPRFWTDTNGNRSMAKLVGVDEKGQIRLEPLGKSVVAFPAENFTAADIEYVISEVTKDQNTEVIPADKFVEPTPSQLVQGYKVLEDRNGNKLTGKFVVYWSHSDKVTMSVLPGNGHVYVPFYGLTKESQEWVTAQRAKKDQERQDRLAAIPKTNPNPSRPFPTTPPGMTNPGSRPNTTFPGLPPNNGLPGSRPNRDRTRITTPTMPEMPSIPEPKMPDYRDRIASRPSVPDFKMPEPPEINIPTMTYEFKCDRCGHEWTREYQSIDTCPSCKGYGSGGGSGSGGSSYTSYNSGAGSSSSSSSGGGSYFVPGPGLIKLIIGVIAFIVMGVVGLVKKAAGGGGGDFHNEYAQKTERSSSRSSRKSSRSRDNDDGNWL